MGHNSDCFPEVYESQEALTFLFPTQKTVCFYHFSFCKNWCLLSILQEYRYRYRPIYRSGPNMFYSVVHFCKAYVAACGGVTERFCFYRLIEKRSQHFTIKEVLCAFLYFCCSTAPVRSPGESQENTVLQNAAPSLREIKVKYLCF